VLTRHEAIGRSYDTLRLASAFAAVIARNPCMKKAGNASTACCGKRSPPSGPPPDPISST